MTYYEKVESVITLAEKPGCSTTFSRPWEMRQPEIDLLLHVCESKRKKKWRTFVVLLKLYMKNTECKICPILAFFQIYLKQFVSLH